MRHNDYKAMIQAQEQIHSNAWQYIFSNWHSASWVSIPTNVKITLALHSSLGMCNGQLVTKTGANGMNEFIQRMNRNRST